MIAGKISHLPYTAKSSEKFVLFLHKNRIFLRSTLHYSPPNRHLGVGSHTLLSNRDFCQARTLTSLPYRYRCAAEVAKDLLPRMRFSGSEVRSRRRDSSLAQRKSAIPKSKLQDIPSQAHNESPQAPPRVGLVILVLANLLIFAGLIHSLAKGLLT